MTVDVDIGAFLVPGSSEEWAWGLRVRVSAVTVYDLYDEPVEDHWAKVTAEYRKQLFLPLVRERAAEQGSSGEWLETEAEVRAGDGRRTTAGPLAHPSSCCCYSLVCRCTFQIPEGNEQEGLTGENTCITCVVVRTNRWIDR